MPCTCEPGVITVVVVNKLNQAVTVQVVGSYSRGAPLVEIGDAITVAAGDAGALTLDPCTAGWLPFISVRVTAGAAPSSGSIDAVAVRPVRGGVQEQWIAKNLEIRDTDPHDPLTDDRIGYAGWVP